MLHRAYLTIKLNRPLKDNEMISPGGFHFTTKNGKGLHFDFYDTEAWTDSDKKVSERYLHFTMKNPDELSFPKIETYTEDDFRNIAQAEDLYMDLEDCEDDLRVKEISHFAIEFEDKENDVFKDIEIDKNVLYDYNERTFNE